jgi:hypothetical protein
MPLDPYQYFTAEQIADASGCALADVRAYWPRIHAQLVLCGLADRPVLIAAIGTAAVESGMRPIHEYGTPADWAGYEGGPAYAGRGFIQTTHRSGYAAAGRAIAQLWGADPADPTFDLVAHPDNLLDPDMAAAALAIYFRDRKTLQGYSIPDAARAGDWDWVRRLVLGGPDPRGTARLSALANALGGTVPTTDPVYDPNTPIVPQNHDWDCAEQATLWALTAYGRHPSDAWLENQMLAEHIESTAEGLLDASGASLAAWIVEQYGEFGYGAYNLPSVTFNDVMVNAGLSPMLIGGRAWNHWSGVRRYNQGTGLLELANPANGWKDVWQTMDRAQFERLGPFSAVIVTWGGQPPRDQGLSIATLQAQVNELSARVDDLTKKRDGLIVAVSYLGDTMADSLTALAKEAQRVRAEQVGPRP